VDSCAVLASFYTGGIVVSRDPAHGVALYRRACELDARTGCAELAGMLERGEGAPRDPAEAARLYKKACDAGLASACH
jgi:TPR repeat protein